MGTRSRIGVMHGNKCKSVYCHWDGYLEHNGRILQDHYDSARANHLVSLGDMSTLGPVLGQAQPFSKLDIADTDADREAKLALMELAQLEGWCTFYGRDRLETDVDFKVAHNFSEFLEQVDNCGGEYYYVMENGVWYCGSMEGEFKGRLVKLSEALEPVGSWETVTV
jgi:hypothetical protein